MEHDDNGNPIDIGLNSTIFHYMGLEHILCMLDSKSFYVKRKCFYKDESESRMLPDRLSFAFEIASTNRPVQRTSEEQFAIDERQRLFAKRSSLLTSCWSLGPYENYLLWECYTKTKYGVCIKSTIGRVLNSFGICNYNIWCGKMIYRKRQQTDTPEDAKWIKPPEYSGEREIRFYFAPKSDMDKVCILSNLGESKNLAVNMETLIDTIILSPKLSLQEREKITSFLHDGYGIEEKKIKKSTISLKF